MPSTTFRPHRTLLAVGSIAVASVLGSGLLHAAAAERAADRIAEQQSSYAAAERAAADLLAAYDTAAPAGIRLVQGFAVAPPEEITADFEHFQAIMSRIQTAWTALEARAEGVVDPAVVGEAGEAMKRYNDYAAEGFTLTELGPDSAVMLITKMREAGGPYTETRDAIVAVGDAARVAADEASAASEAAVAAERQRLRTVDGALAIGVAVLVVVGALRLRRGAARVRRSVEQLARADHRSDFESRLQRGLEMANAEDTAFEIAAPALAEAIGEGAAAELLVADSGRGPLRRVAATADRPGCDVASADRCPAARRGQTLSFPTSTALDVCPHLKARPGGDCSALCVPVNVGGNAVGVVHVTGPDGEPLDDERASRVEVVARRASDRITVLRVFAHTGGPATDALTGLIDRRSLEERVRELETDPAAVYAVAFGDLDRFKLFNDVHGPDGGDRALRLFGGVLRDSVRPSDIPARYGGEEFLVVLPGCSADEAQRAMDRVRENLGLALASGRVPPFTVSFGIATSGEGRSFGEVLATADAALLAAKAAGRDRVLLAGTG